MSEVKVLIFAGSTRTASFNKQLARVCEKIMQPMQIGITYLDLRDFSMPLYDGDLEVAQGLPENALRLREIMKEHAGFLLACPEYNSSISGVLKNTIDWTSRPREGEPDLVCFKGKVVHLVSASPGKWGGMRGLATVRSILGNVGCLVMPNQFCLPFADKAFTANGNLSDETLQKILEAGCLEFVKAVKKMNV